MKESTNQPKRLKSQQAKRKKVKLPKYSKLSKRLIKEFDDFVESTPAARLSKNLRDMFLLYSALEKDGLPMQFHEEFITDFYFLMQLLDAVGEEMPGE